jgi:hypothetical protein
MWHNLLQPARHTNTPIPYPHAPVAIGRALHHDVPNAQEVKKEFPFVGGLGPSVGVSVGVQKSEYTLTKVRYEDGTVRGPKNGKAKKK